MLVPLKTSLTSTLAWMLYRVSKVEYGVLSSMFVKKSMGRLLSALLKPAEKEHRRAQRLGEVFLVWD